MFDTSMTDEDLEYGTSRTKLRAERKDHQARLEALAMRLARIAENEKKFAALDLELEDGTEEQLRGLAMMKAGSALARQRRRVASLLRHLDLDEIEKRLDKREGAR